MRKRSGLRNGVEAALAHGLIALLQYSPRSAADALGSGCGRLLDVLVPRLRTTAYRNLEFAYPGHDAAWRRHTVDGVYRSIGRLLVALARFPSMDRNNVGQWIGYEGFEHYEQAKAAGRGVLFATAHLGNWELSAFAHALLTEKMSIVVRPLDNPLLDDLVETRRGLSGNKLLSRRDFARSILHALRDNEPVGVLVDQNSAGENSAFVPFFGKPACTNLTFAKLAARSGAAVIPGFAVWNESQRRYTLKFYPPVPMSGDAVGDTARIQAAVERAIREYPDQWLWIHRRWKTRPPGEPPVY
ncbi:MAG TPA: lysophospholipid acyltransferase family protein [Bryobacteraceae bacterium]|nr:lysophospholipid acyltransferase family protein [Bryobacteraceae bacterium]